MTTKRDRKSVCLATSLLVLLLNPWVHSQDDFPLEADTAALVEILADALDCARTEFEILDEREVVFTNNDNVVRLYKTLNNETGRLETIALDANNDRVDYNELVRTRQESELASRGAADVRLHERLEGGGRGVIPVMLQMRTDVEPIGLDEFLESGEALDEMAVEAEERVNEVEASAFEALEEVLGAVGVAPPDERIQDGPFFMLELPMDTIRALVHEPSVLYIGLSEDEVVLDGQSSPELPDFPTIPMSLPATRTDLVHGETRGKNVNVVVLSPGGLWKDRACFNIADIQEAGRTPHKHMTMSVGIIGNRFDNGQCGGQWQGYAPEAKVYIANGFLPRAPHYIDAYSWARTKGVNVISMSWHYRSEESKGALHSRDRYFDYWALYVPFPTIFTSAGNDSDKDVFASGKGYQVIGVGNLLNEGKGRRCDAEISFSSSWKNPTTPHSDRELPELVAPGSRHSLLGGTFGKTSCATPVAASIASLLMAKYDQLKIRPEAIRAILLATANYQGADHSDWDPVYDGKDGTGLINAELALETASRRESTTASQPWAHDYGTMTSADFVDGIFEREWQAHAATVNSRIRVAFTWNSKADSTTSSVLDANLDLLIYDSSMTLVGSSVSYDSNYEFVEFSPTKLGSYTIQVHENGLANDFESKFGIAWTVHNDCP